MPKTTVPFRTSVLMQKATGPVHTSVVFVIGLAAGLAAFGWLAASGRGPDVAESDDVREGAPVPLAERPSPPELAPALLRPDTPALDQETRSAPAADLTSASGRHEVSRRMPVVADVRPVGAWSAATPPAAAPPAPLAPTEEPQQSQGEVRALHQQLVAARADAQLRLQQQLNEQVAAIRSLLAEEQAREEAAVAAAQDAMARTGAALDALQLVQGRLVTGDSDVLGSLEEASSALPAPARRAVEQARTAIASEDLYRARFWLRVAAAETQYVQLRP